MLFNKELAEEKKVPFDNGLYIALIIVLLRELESLLKDTFGFLFESLVERDLRIYIESLDGNLYHFRDN